jgi:hypothetical protein
MSRARLLAFVMLAAAPAHANLVTNPGFETTSSTCDGGSHWDSAPSCATGWRAYSSGDATLKRVALPGNHDVGDGALEVSLGSSSGYKAGQVQWTIPVSPGEKYVFSALAMADDLRSEALIQAEGRTSAGVWLGPSEGTISQGSFVWKRIQLAMTAPSSASTLSFRLRNQTIGGCRGTLSAGPGCGTVWFDDVSLVEVDEFPSDPEPNLCPPGEFLKLSSKECVALLAPDRGFDPAPFETATINEYSLTAGQCTHAQLASRLSAIAALPSGSFARLTLPACEIDLTSYLFLPGNLILQGAGPGRTRIRTRLNDAAGHAARAFFIDAVTNVVVRDLTVDGERVSTPPTPPPDYPDNNAVSISDASNVLIERTEVIHAGSTGIVWKNSPNVSVRYSVVSHTENTGHGIGCSDCEGSSVCPPSVTESAEYQVLSSWSHHVKGFPIDVHSMGGEIAGNLLTNAALGGIKFPDAVDLSVRHNRISSNAGDGVPFQKDWRVPAGILVESNTITSNGGAGIDVVLGNGVELRDNWIASNAGSGVSAGDGWGNPPIGVQDLLVVGNVLRGNVGYEARIKDHVDGAALEFNHYELPHATLDEIYLTASGVTACDGSDEEALQLAGEVAPSSLGIVTCP